MQALPVVLFTREPLNPRALIQDRLAVIGEMSLIQRYEGVHLLRVGGREGVGEATSEGTGPAEVPQLDGKEIEERCTTYGNNYCLRDSRRPVQSQDDIDTEKSTLE